MGSIIIGGTSYGPTQIDPKDFTAVRSLGKASEYELIKTPINVGYVNGDEEIFTVAEKDNLLIFRSPDGTSKIFVSCE